MTKKYGQHKKIRKVSRSSRSSSSNSSRSSCSLTKVCNKKSSSSSSRSKSFSTSRSRSNSRSNSTSRSRSNSRSHSKSNSRSRSSSSNSSYEKKNFKQKYNYYKRHLLADPELMMANADAYVTALETNPQTVVAAGAVLYKTYRSQYNIDHTTTGATQFVRKDGVYLIEFTAQMSQPVQFAFFINDVFFPVSAFGQNAGSGEIIGRLLTPLRKNDGVCVRNYRSSQGTIDIDPSQGGTQIAISTELTLRKIAPYPNVCPCPPLNNFKVSHKRREFFHYLLNKMKCDPDLSFKGSEAYGSFYLENTQDIALEAPVVFGNTTAVKGLVLQPNNSDILIPMDGIYNIIFLLECTKSCQFGLFINGAASNMDTVGINKGANQVYLHQYLQFNKGDVLSMRNHSSNAGTVTTAQASGGLLLGINAAFIVTRIAPLPNPNFPLTEQCCKLPRNVRKFKKYLLHEAHEHRLMPKGSDCYFQVARHNIIDPLLPVGEAITFETVNAMHNVEFITGTNTVTVCRSGIYKLFVEVNATTPTQTTVFVNGVALPETTEGTDSGSGQSAMRQLVALCKGDKLTLVNWQSLTPIKLTVNAGGLEIGTNVDFTGIKIAEIPHDGYQPCKLGKPGKPGK